MEKTRKIGLFSCICIAIGIIVGAGIFGALPVAVEMTGKGIALAFLLATITIVLRYYPTIITGAAIPASFGYYMHTTRLAGPYLGFTQVIASFSNIFVQAILATVFAMYFAALVPIDTRIIAVAVLLIFGAITCVGIRASGVVQNFMVLLLFSALFTYIIGGFPHIKPANLTFSEIFFPPDQSFFLFRFFFRFRAFFLFILLRRIRSSYFILFAAFTNFPILLIFRYLTIFHFSTFAFSLLRYKETESVTIKKTGSAAIHASMRLPSMSVLLKLKSASPGVPDRNFHRPARLSISRR